jgi:hypothetical protein
MCDQNKYGMDDPEISPELKAFAESLPIAPQNSGSQSAGAPGYVADLRYYVKDSAGAYIVGVGNGATWWGNKARAIPFEKREAELRAKRGFYTDGSQQGSIEEAPATLRIDFTKPHNKSSSATDGGGK